MDDSIYKILTDSQWIAFKESGGFLGTPVDIKDGYIHLSRQAQVRGVIDRYYAGQRPLYVAEFSAEAFGECLKWEPATNGELYPHVYGRGLLLTEVLSLKRED